MLEESLLRTLGPTLGVEETALYRVDSDGNVVRSICHSHVLGASDGDERQITDSIQETSNPGELPEEVRDLVEQVRVLRAPSRRADRDSLLHCYPIFAKEDICGYFLFRRAHAVTAPEEAVVRGVLAVFKNYYDLLDMSLRDRLTGLYNRHALEQSIDRIWSLLLSQLKDPPRTDPRRRYRASRYWIGLIDIDHFKAINDRHGHLIGDEILILIARAFKTTFRKGDLIYRYGGEEFAVIVSAETLEIAQLVFERTRRKVESFVFPAVGSVTVSVGFSEADPGLVPIESLNRADRALYAAKRRGRNRVMSFESLRSEGAVEALESGSVELF